MSPRARDGWALGDTAITISCSEPLVHIGFARAGASGEGLGDAGEVCVRRRLAWYVFIAYPGFVQVRVARSRRHVAFRPVRVTLASSRRRAYAARRLGGVDIIGVKTSTQQAADRVATVLGPVLAIAVAWVSSRVRSDISIANAALALAFVCVAAALVSPIAGFATSAVAALALNYFHTTPIHSLRMTEPDEVVTVILLVLLGSSVSVATT